MQYLNSYLGIIIYAIIMIAASFYCMEKRDPITTWIKENTDGCVIECPGPISKKFRKHCPRGDSFLLASGIFTDEESLRKRKEDCLFGVWHFIHFFTYFLAGALFPSFLFEVLGTSVVFEYVESKTCDCHDVLDVGINVGAFLMGREAQKATYDAPEKKWY